MNNPDQISESLKNHLFFLVKIVNSVMCIGVYWKNVGYGLVKDVSGINIRDPQHYD